MRCGAGTVSSFTYRMAGISRASSTTTELASGMPTSPPAFCSTTGSPSAARTVLGRQLPAQNLWQLLGLGLAKEILRRRGVFATAVCRRSVAALDAADHEELDHALELVREDCRSLEGVA